MNIRTVKESDYAEVIAVLNDWWGGRPMSDMLPKLFFVHFQPTSFIAEQDGAIIGFLIGFPSQTYPQEAYIHFIGVHPDHRKNGVARRLYETFIDNVGQLGCDTVRCITSPLNTTSIAFHTRMGFRIEPGDSEAEGVSVHSNYDRRGESRVLFFKKIGTPC
ncbi:GNAT family N-acetyltransferase [Paenibacillus thiaminolyticus]|uniref:GNAT family N-acetyltransferase n=1 Tax=Paenibacillus thiaminolyticus TaxID=49283 RepID=A0AAP9J110_PANTH|nr:GNAT family N-acetyltransferase [Paenibacillus thiaminolyticus]MCY9537589.1 GNAT family N-acetyltransferase [Paenibacillus thiaminolyticus]MCY9600702.1 GNAT family N-acetyltransferase [Paenibacillus thiaminolyticus]MCY9607530.1 GNAT family N-acetyltransferase [Paenibacillus thiaminolyticus]MCY9611330.1 GNAT family N-acetyltransferase [Paenibacillus thiaminolyticus]MCY9617399.1 GNAT family N-acetyltransferase [Paenibacillus thiaminolyticus]